MPFVKSVDGEGGVKFRLADSSSQTEEFTIEFAAGVSASVGRGTTDTDVVYIRLKNTDGESAYVFPNATQDGITVQGTRP